MAKRRQPRNTDPARAAAPSRAAGHRAKIWLATISTVVGVATGMFTLRDQVFPSEAGSAGAMSASGYQEHVGRICDEVNANDRLRAHEDSRLRVGLPRARTTIDQRNLLLDAVRRTIARDGHALAAFTGLAAPTAMTSVRHDTGTAWNRNLARVRDYALRLDGAGTRPQLVGALVHLSTLRPLLAADGVRFASGLKHLGGAECDLHSPVVTTTITLPPLRRHEPLGPTPANTPGRAAMAPNPNAPKHRGDSRRRRAAPRRVAVAPRRPTTSGGSATHTWTGRGTFRVNTPGSQATIHG